MNNASDRERLGWIKHCIVVFCICCAAYLLTGYFGIRSPDSEIVYRAGESLVKGEGFAVKPLESWEAHGVATGIDGKIYSIFGPGQSIIIYPLIKLAHWINSGGWYDSYPHLVQISPYEADNRDLILNKKGEPISNRGPHADRQLVTLMLNVPVTALCIVVFWLMLYRMTGSYWGAGLPSLVLGIGTPFWHYSGTFFSEPLATLFLMTSFYFLVRNDPGFGNVRHERFNLAMSGFLVGMSVDTHISAILFVPFFIAYVVYLSYVQKAQSRNHSAANVLAFLVPFGVMLGLLLWFNHVRFGDILETGRGLGESQNDTVYGHWTSPWAGLWGLIFSSGKGIVLYSPAVLAGVFSLKYFYSRHRALALLVVAMVAFRVLLISCRTDWNGGFSLGPRYLLMAIPFMLLPLGVMLEQKNMQISRKVGFGTAALFVFSSHQLYFNIGEIFEFSYNTLRLSFIRGEYMFFEWKYSPLLHILEGKRGSYLLDAIEAGNYVVWAMGSMALAFFAYSVYWFFCPVIQDSD
jgi:hypothetical protein